MRKESVILIAEDDEQRFSLVTEALQHSGISNKMLRFSDGRGLLDFLFTDKQGPKQQGSGGYLLLLQTSIPKIDGIGVLEKIKQDEQLKRVPVIMLSTIDEPGVIEHCYSLGCSIYIVTPAERETFTDVVGKLGLFLSAIDVPQVSTIE